MTRKLILVAGIGNVFLGDDAFGVEVVWRLAQMPLGDHVRVLDVGTRSLHLAYELLDGHFDTVILVDAVSRGHAPGTLSVLALDSSTGLAPNVDAHSVRPEHVLGMLKALGGEVGCTMLVGCEPGPIDGRFGLSAAVHAAVDEAAAIVCRLVREASESRPVEIAS